VWAVDRDIQPLGSALDERLLGGRTELDCRP
jgi:hypothetical protein